MIKRRRIVGSRRVRVRVDKLVAVLVGKLLSWMMMGVVRVRVKVAIQKGDFAHESRLRGR